MAGLEKQVGGGSGRTREAGGRGAVAGLEKQVGGGSGRTREAGGRGQWQD